jgi:carboxypeptidase C (cathepsin A)
MGSQPSCRIRPVPHLIAIRGKSPLSESRSRRFGLGNAAFVRQTKKADPMPTGERHAMRLQPFLLFAAAVSLSAPATAALAAAPPLFAPGDESIATTSHTIRTPTGTFQYQSRAGRLPIRNAETGEVRGRVYFSAYVMPSADGQPRPITFLWNGGPSVNSLLLHTEMFGPRRIEGDRFVDNLETLLTVSDLVFYDPVGTGFSRPESAEAAAEFYSVLGDFAATAEFIRAYRARFGAERQPLFLVGESYGTWRAGGVAERLAAAEIDVDGVILISGGIPGSQMPYAFSDAMFVPARTAAAFHHRRLPADLMANRAATLRQAAEWSRTVYLPALERLETLGEEEREAIARNLARFTGLRPELIDRATLVVPNRDFLRLLHEGDSGRRLDTFDMRRFAGEAGHPGRRETIGGYFRRELGYATDLVYAGLEPGYTPEPGPAARSPSQLWSYNHVEITPEMLARAQAGGGPPGSQPWLQNAMRANRELRVFVAAGRFDSLNMCEGNEAIVARLEADLARRFTTRCYEGGHMMYRDVEERRALARDVRQFVVAATEERE